MHDAMAVFCLLGLVFGNLNNGTANAGVGCSNGDNTLGNARWNILARISELIVSNLLFTPSCIPCCGKN